MAIQKHQETEYRLDHVSLCISVWPVYSLESLVNLLSRKQQNIAACGIFTKFWQLSHARNTIMQRGRSPCLSIFMLFLCPQPCVLNCSCSWGISILTYHSELFSTEFVLFRSCLTLKEEGNSSISLSVSPPFKVKTCAWQRFLFGLKPFSIEVKFSIHVEALFNYFSRLCFIPTFKTFSEDCLPSPYPPLFSSGVRACWKQWNNICMLLVIINYGDSAQHRHLRASLSRSDISSISWKLGECMVVSYTIFICSCPETSISQTHLYLS